VFSPEIYDGEDSSHCASIFSIQIVYSFTGRWQFQMSSSSTSVAIEKIDRLFCCAECKVVFLFESDAIDHQAASGHPRMAEMPFE
jgi:hypothetical protein